jgi:phage tail P2-like protein
MADPLLPPPLAKDARCRILADLIARISGVDLSPVLVYLIDAVDASVLPFLAEQFNALDEGWADAATDAARRKLLRRAIDLHRHKGTKWAVETALDVLGLACGVQEWFEYGGEPYRFRVELVSDKPISEAFWTDGINRAVELILHAKNVRSHLDALRIVLAAVSAVPQVGMACLSGEVATLYPFIQTDIERRDGHPVIALGPQIVETVTLYPLAA